MDRFAARRKLLRGSLSAPLVLTVASPAALARQSFEACLYRATNNGATQGTPPGESVFIDFAKHDPWLRATVKMYDGSLVTDGGSTTVRSPTGISGSDAIFYEIVGQEGKFYPAVGPCSVPAGYLPNGTNPPTDRNEKKKALVFVGSDGSIVGFGTCPNNGYAVTTSCYASFGGLGNLP